MTDEITLEQDVDEVLGMAETAEAVRAPRRRGRASPTLQVGG